MKTLVLFVFLLTLSCFKVIYAEIPSSDTFSDMNYILFETLRKQSRSKVKPYEWNSTTPYYVHLYRPEYERRRRFFRAVFYGDLASAHILISNGVDVDMTLNSILGEKTLEDLFYNEDLQEFKPLVGFTPLYIASMYEHYEIVKLLLEKGANPNGVGKALYLANCFLRPRDFEAVPEMRDLFDKYEASYSSCETFLPKLTFGFHLEALLEKIGLLEKFTEEQNADPLKPLY